MMIATELTPSLQQIIDARLDTIERTLMSGTMSRSDRKQILSAVEEQIMDLLSRVDTDNPSREDILGVLATLDPPEAYLDMAIGSEREIKRPMPRQFSSSQGFYPASTTQPTGFLFTYNRWALVGFALLCMNCLLALGWWMLDILGLFVIGFLCLPSTICGIVALAQNHSRPQPGLWMAILATISTVVVGFVALMTYSFLVAMNW